MGKHVSFGRYVHMLFSQQIQEEDKTRSITREAVDCFDFFIEKFLDKLFRETQKHTLGRIIKVDDLSVGMLYALPSLQNTALSIINAGKAAVQQFLTHDANAHNYVRTPQNFKAQVVFPTSRLRKLLQINFPAQRVSKMSPVFLAGALDALIQHIFKLCRQYTSIERPARFSSSIIEAGLKGNLCLSPIIHSWQKRQEQKQRQAADVTFFKPAATTVH